MSFFPMFLLVLPLGVVLVALNFFCGLARPVEIRLARMLGADGDVGQETIELPALALGAGGDVAGPHEQLELMMAAAALVFVDRHGEKLSRRQRPIPNFQLPRGYREERGSRKTCKGSIRGLYGERV